MVLIGGIVTQFGVSGLLMCTAMAGVMLIIMGITGLGTTVRFIPRSVTIGFTNGIAVIIASNEIKDFFGLKAVPIPRDVVDSQFMGSDFVARSVGLTRAASSVSSTATIVAIVTLSIVLLWPWVTKKIPGSIVG